MHITACCTLKLVACERFAAGVQQRVGLGLGALLEVHHVGDAQHNGNSRKNHKRNHGRVHLGLLLLRVLLEHLSVLGLPLFVCQQRVLAKSGEAPLASLSAGVLAKVRPICARNLEIDRDKIPHLLPVAGRVFGEHVPLLNRHKQRALLAQTVAAVPQDIRLDDNRTLIEVPVLVEGREPEQSFLALTTLVHGLAIMAANHLVDSVNAARRLAHDRVAPRDGQVTSFHTKQLDIPVRVHFAVLRLIKVIVVHVVVLRVVVLVLISVFAILIDIPVDVVVTVLAVRPIVLVIPVAVVVIIIVLVIVAVLRLVVVVADLPVINIAVVALISLKPVVFLVCCALKSGGPSQQQHQQRAHNEYRTSHLDRLTLRLKTSR
mmetsp:Transcript_3739/g.6851  ORF Transcript_3739/g.6851 Transcript_3739/m.6851 type:complete len:375 (-) Transcript_3739:232-1356(-)